MQPIKAHVRLVALLGLLSLAALASACTEAGKCERGQPGCACTQEEECASGALCVNGTCEEDPDPPPETDGGTGNGDDGGTGEEDSGTPDPQACTGETLEEACGNFCEALCQNEERHCIVSNCEPGDCEPSDDDEDTVFDVCMGQCSGSDDPAACAQSRCRQQQSQTCPDFGFEDNNGLFLSGCFQNDPVCVHAPELGCSDTCGTSEQETGGDLAKNDECNDGGSSSDSSECPRGTDCSDCGKRQCASSGAGCESNGDCCGFFGEGAFCVDVPALGPTCLLNCSESMMCPDPLSCLPIDQDGTFVCAPPMN